MSDTVAHHLLKFAVLAGLFALAAAAPAQAGARASVPGLAPIIPVIVEQPCPGQPDAGACYAADLNLIYAPDGLNRFERLHEYGHAFDAQLLDDAERASFARMIGNPDGPWESRVRCDYPGDEDCSGDKETGNEEFFADEYATCRMRLLPEGRRVHGAIVGDWVYSHGYAPATNAKQRRICRSITRWGKAEDLRRARS